MESFSLTGRLLCRLPPSKTNIRQCGNQMDAIRYYSFLAVLILSISDVYGEGSRADDPIKSDPPLSWSEIRVVEIEQISTDKCRMLKRETCSSKRGYAYCNRWHQKRAVREKANTVAILIFE